MPQIKIISSSGPASIAYTIATPTSENAQTIDPTLPIVLFLHPMYLGQATFHFQFANAQLRRCNLIAFDARAHGATVGKVPTDYRRAGAADDVFKFMEALRLPACHFVGMEMGACVALQTAITYPHKVLSLFMISPPSLVEPELVGAGRQEIYDCWAKGWKGTQMKDQDALHDAIFGAVQLGFNGASSTLVSAFVRLALSDALRNWSYDHLEEFHTISVNFFTDREPHTVDTVKEVQCPIHLIHCAEDIAYPVQFVQELHQLLEDAGLDVKTSTVPDAAHSGMMLDPEPFNELLIEWLAEHSKQWPSPRSKDRVTSPYANDLERLGFKSADTDDDESEVDNAYFSTVAI